MWIELELFPHVRVDRNWYTATIMSRCSIHLNFPHFGNVRTHTYIMSIVFTCLFIDFWTRLNVGRAINTNNVLLARHFGTTTKKHKLCCIRSMKNKHHG